MIRDQFLMLLLQLVGRDDSSSEISAATQACEELLLGRVELLCEEMWWTSTEQDVMTLLFVFYHTHRRAPSWREFREYLKEHVIRYGAITSPDQRTAFERLLTYDFQQLAQALLAASVLQKDAKVAEYKEVKPTKPSESTKPVTEDAFWRVQQIPQGEPEQQPKPVQQRKPKPVHHMRPELPEASKPMSPEILPGHSAR